MDGHDVNTMALRQARIRDRRHGFGTDDTAFGRTMRLLVVISKVQAAS